MSMATIDISALGTLQPSEPLDLDNYVDAQPFQLPVAGTYLLQAPEFTIANFSPTAGGQLKADVSPTVVGPTNAGFKLRRQSVSAKNFERNGQQVSMAGLYLKKCGWTGPVPSDPNELADAIASTAGKTYEARLDWEADHRATGFKVRGMKNFPSDGRGGYQSWIEHPTEKGADGEPLRLRANVNIRW